MNEYLKAQRRALENISRGKSHGYMVSVLSSFSMGFPDLSRLDLLCGPHSGSMEMVEIVSAEKIKNGRAGWLCRSRRNEVVYNSRYDPLSTGVFLTDRLVDAKAFAEARIRMNVRAEKTVQKLVDIVNLFLDVNWDWPCGERPAWDMV